MSKISTKNLNNNKYKTIKTHKLNFLLNLNGSSKLSISSIIKSIDVAHIYKN